MVILWFHGGDIMTQELDEALKSLGFGHVLSDDEVEEYTAKDPEFDAQSQED